MSTVLTILHVLVCLFLIMVVLLQAGKGGGMGLAFGGNSQTVFGGSGAGNFLTRLTSITAIVYLVTSLTLAYLASARGAGGLRTYAERAKHQAKQEEEPKKSLEAQGKAMESGGQSAPAPEGATPPAPEGATPPAPEGATPLAPEGATPPAPGAAIPPAPGAAPPPAPGAAPPPA